MEVETAGTQLPKEPQISSHTQKKDQPDNKDVYTVEKVLDKKVENGQKLYLIKWEGYPTSQSTWEPVENLLSVIDIIVEYEVRECTRQEEKEHAKADESPKNHSKRKADRSLSEEDVVKKVKGDSSEAKEKTSRKESQEEDDDEEDDDEDDDDDEKETMQEKLHRRKKHLSRLRAFQGKEFTDQETLAKVSKNINMAHPFVIETVKDEDLEGSESEEEDDEDLSDAPKRKRGRPRKIRTERGDGIVRKRGRPRKIRPEGVEGETAGPKRGPGRPRKHPVEDEEGKEAKHEAPRKRGRPRKNPTMEEKEDEEGEDVKEGDDTTKEPKEPKEGGENNETPAVAAPKKRGRPRKEVQYKEIEESEGSGEEDEHAEDKETKAEKKEEGDKMETEEKEGEEKGENGEEKEAEGASPTAFLKARKEAVLKRRGLSLEEGKVSAEGVVKRGRGRPRKNRDVEPTSATVAEGEEEDKDKEKSELKKENEEEETKEKEGLENEEEGEEHDEDEEGESEEEEEEGDRAKSQPARKRGRPRKNQPRKRGRPRKEVRVTREEEEENASKEQNAEEESAPAAPRKRGRPRKIVTDVNKENDYQSGYGKGEQEDQAGVNSSILGVRSGQSTEGEPNQKKQSASAHKFGSLNEKDLPKRIIKARVVTDKGCIFLIEWEKRPSGEQPQNSHVTSHELKNFDPSFLLEYYEEIVKKNLKNKVAPPKEEVAPRDEDMIPVEQNPELFGSFAFHDNPKEIIKVQSADQEGWEFMVRWEPRNNNIQPLDSVVNNEALKLHDPNFLISYYESKIRAKPGEEAVIALDILDPVDEKETEQGESDKNAEVPAGEAGGNIAATETVMQQEPIAQD